MLTARFRMKGAAIFATASLALAMTATPTLAGPSAPTSGRELSPTTQFFVPTPDKGAVKQIKDLVKQGDLSNAALLTAMVAEGHAVWFTGGTPGNVFGQVRQTMMLAKAQNTVPVLVAYNLPFRDCGQYSAGGAADTASYEAWIDAFARGIGNGEAIVILEPDGLGIIPYNLPIYGGMEWCQPALPDGMTPEAANAARYEQLNYAVDRLEQQANVSVYLDGTHSAWLGVGEAAYRLMKAGVERADGFFVNVSNYQTTETSTIFGTWVSKCIAAATSGVNWAIGHPEYCPGQYVGPTPDYSTTHVDEVNSGLAGMLGTATPTTHFVIDTGRNGQGPWSGNLDWCNPPDRGLGIPPTTSTGNDLIDAYLWVKVPGESDGSCARPADGTTDVEWGGIVDPAAGAWFPQQALQLAQLAKPPLLH